MPELPEVETVVRGLRYLEGSKLDRVETFDKKVWFESALSSRSLNGLKLKEVTRRGKYFILRFPGVSLLGHLRMTGKILPEANTSIPAAVRSAIGQKQGKGLQVRCRFRFQRENLVFFDTRRFGTLTIVTSEEEYFSRKKIAPDPLNHPKESLQHFLKTMPLSKKPAKAALLDQSIFSGAGNIYADEVLFQKGIHPLQPAYTITDLEPLWKELVRILRASIVSGGTTIIDYVNSQGKKGTFSQKLFVYGRDREPCKKCGSILEKITIVGRSSHFCPQCQPLKNSKSKKRK